MKLEDAKKILNVCIRHELRDHAFGDAEVYWFYGGKEIAFGYRGRNPEVSLTPISRFEGNEARELLDCGIEGEVTRNDEVGPEDFVEGRIMPGLTNRDIRRELTGS